MSELSKKLDAIAARCSSVCDEPNTNFVMHQFNELLEVVRQMEARQSRLALVQTFEHGVCKKCDDKAGDEPHRCPFYSAGDELCNCCRDCTEDCSMAN